MQEAAGRNPGPILDMGSGDIAVRSACGRNYSSRENPYHDIYCQTGPLSVIVMP